MTTATKWRTSASLILVSPASKASEDYNLLMLKRSDATAMVQNQTVFPGGLLDAADESVSWLEYFDQFGVPEIQLRRLVLISEHRPSLLAPQGTGCYDRFFKRSKIWAREITLRLTALRECFEEVGILLCRNREQLSQLDKDNPPAQYLQAFDRESWQRRVHEKSSDFLELCRELKVVPDLWALHEWSAWASPAIVKKGYETAFFMAFLNTQPSLLMEPTEVKECLWRSPLEFLRLLQHGQIWFMPPQIYELSRLLSIRDYHKLEVFTVQRSKLGTTLLMPIGYQCTDSLVYVLPGDDYYVPEPQLVTEFIGFPGTTTEFRSRSKCLHRYEFLSPTSLKFQLNFKNINGHLSPQEIPLDLHKLITYILSPFIRDARSIYPVLKLLFGSVFGHWVQRLTDAQNKRSSRVTNSRSFGTNVKSTSSNGISFDCPEEFGYYPHPSDCTQYYVCVFGGALLESCTGGLMYSHELQTCDWPRNVGCQVVDSGSSASSTEVGSTSRNKAQQQHVPSRIRFGAAFTSPGSTQKTVTVPPQYHRSPPQIIQAQVQHIPPPPELRVPPNPVVTSRGQPKALLDSQEEIAKLYEEAQETLPPLEEEESDRQQRVYRGQPSTVSQVQRDRDGIIHQASINAIPNHDKIGSYTFGTAYSESLTDHLTIGHELSHNRLDLDGRRKRRDVAELETTTPAEVNSDSNVSSQVTEPDTSIKSQLSGDATYTLNNSNNSQENFENVAATETQPKKYSSKIIQAKTSNIVGLDHKENDFVYEDFDYMDKNEDNNDTIVGESKRRPRQLRPYSHVSPKWSSNNFRSIDAPSHQNNIPKNGYSFGSYNPYLTPPSQQTHNNYNYNQLGGNLGYKVHPLQQHQQHQQHQQSTLAYGQKPAVVYTGYNLSLPPPPIEDDFRPIAGNYYGAASSSSSRPPLGYQEQSQKSELLPYLIEQLKELKERRKQIQTENFAYFHLDNQPIPLNPLAIQSTTQATVFDYNSTPKPLQVVTPNGHYAQYSTMGGFYNNNKPEQLANVSNYSGKLVSQYSIGQGQEPQSTPAISTESNYFQYNIIANQKMKGVYNTAKLNQIEQAAVKVRPPVTPLQVTPNFNIVSAPNLAINNPSNLQQIPFQDLPHLPVGITYASNSTLPESYQTFTKSISSTAPPKLEIFKTQQYPKPIPLTTSKPQLTNFQFNINEFMANLKASDLASINPAINPLIKYFKQVSDEGSGNIRNAVVLRRPVSTTSSTVSTTTPRSLLRTKPNPTNPSTVASTTRILKGYENFFKNIQSHNAKEAGIINQSTTTSIPRIKSTTTTTTSTTTESPVDFYDEDYDEGVDEDMLPPSHMPPYMPMSETMAPPRPQVTTDRTTTEMSVKTRLNLQTGFMQATTTRRPFPNFSQQNQANSGSGVPAFIRFPSDIFQELKQRLPQLTDNHNTRIRVTSTVGTTTPGPTKLRYTVRPHRTRGQQKWQGQAMDNPDEADHPKKQTNPEITKTKSSINTSSLGGVHLNSIHSSSNADRQRVDSSSPSSLTAQTTDNIFVQPSSQAPPPQLASNRNYYNTSIFNHGVGYQITQQARQPQQPQQPTPFQQPQQQQQQAHLSNPYDSSYYSIYDDDIDLYRDIEYQQQQKQQQQQQQQQQHQHQQYQPNVRQQQSTYRPLEILTTPTPAQQRPTYNQPALSYNTEYDEDVNAQIEQDNAYDQPTRTPQSAAEVVTIQTPAGRATASTASSPAVTHDARTYYDTFTTENLSYEEGDFSYSSSDEDYYHSERSPVKTSLSLKSIDMGEYNLNANDVTPSSLQYKVGQTVKQPTTPYPTATPTRASIFKSSPITNRSTSKTTTTTTQKATTTTSPTTTTTTTLPPSSSKTHANKSIKQIDIIKLKTTTSTTTATIPRTTQAPSTTSTNPTTTSTTSTTMSTPSIPPYGLNPFLKSKLQFLATSLVSAVSQIQSRKNSKPLNPIQPTDPIIPLSEQWSTLDDSANSSTIKNIETIYDESQKIQVQTAGVPSSRSFETSTSPKFLDFINAAAYGNGNSVRTPTQKSFKTKYVKDGIYHSFEKVHSSSTEENQNKRIQSFVLSDVKPQSFRAATNSKPEALPAELVDGSSTNRPNNAYYYSLQSGSHGFSLKAEPSVAERNASEPLFQREYRGDLHELSTTSRTTTTSATPTTPTTEIPTPTSVPAYVITESYEDVLPTTYAPLRIWRNGRPTFKQLHSKQTISGSIINTSSTTKAPISTTTSTERASTGQSFTARANLFKDNLNRVTSNPAMRFVSPYKSLESLLQDERLPNNNLRATTRSRFGNGPSAPFLQTTPKPNKNIFISTPPNNSSQTILATLSTDNVRNFSISDVILNTFSPQRIAPSMLRETTTTRSSTTTTSRSTTTTTTPIGTPTEPEQTTTTILRPTISTVVTSSPIQVSESPVRPRGRSRYTVATANYYLDNDDEPTTYAPKFKIPKNYEARSSTSNPYARRKAHRVRVANSLRQTSFGPTAKSREKYESYKAAQLAKETINNYQVKPNKVKNNPIENETNFPDGPRAEALIAQLPFEAKKSNSIEVSASTEPSSAFIDISGSTEAVISDSPPVKFLYSNKYRQQTADRTLADSLQNAGYITTANGRSKFRNVNVLEQLQHFLAASDSDESGSPQFVDEISAPEIKASINEIKLVNSQTSRNTATTSRSTTTLPTVLVSTTRSPNMISKAHPSKLFNPFSSTSTYTSTSTTTVSPFLAASISSKDRTVGKLKHSSTPEVSTTPTTLLSSTTTTSTTSVIATASSSDPSFAPPPTTRVSRVNNAIKSSIAAAAAQSSSLGASSTSISSTSHMLGGRVSKFQYDIAPSNINYDNNNHQHQYNINNAASAVAVAAGSVKCSDSTLSTKCNEIPSRNNNRNRGNAIYTNQDRDTLSLPNRGTHPPRTRPTLKPSGSIVSKAQEFVDIYRYPALRPDPVYPQPTPDKTAAKCRKDVCLLPDCYCGGKDIPGELPVESIPQIVLLTFDDSVNDLNKQLYTDLFEKGRVNPNGCPITATFYVSHEWTDYSQVQNLYSDGHEMASHTVSHSFGEQFSQKKWTREIAGQREILAAYGGVKLSDVRGMRAPFLSVGGNKMYKMLYDSNFTYDSSMPVYENRPPSWPYTLDYKIFHDCMIPPCPTRSYPGVWQVPMVMWQDLNGGRCSMGDACSNPSDAEGVTKMIMKNFERHYTTNRAPFGLFYHAAWFTQPHHKEGFIKFLDAINAMKDVWIITNWQALQWVRDPTPSSRINSFQPFQCDFSDRPKRCNNPKVCNLWHKSGVRYMKTCQPCPDIYPWTGKSGIRSSRIDNEVEEAPQSPQ